jgi:hypothetical protein
MGSPRKKLAFVSPALVLKKLKNWSLYKEFQFLQFKQFFFEWHSLRLLPLFYAMLRCNIFKNLLNIFFAHENMKKTPSKVAHNRPQFFFQYWPGCLNQPRIDFS